ncbi:phosphatase PAP2 family protein [Streptomyces sp. NPDC001744]|uniref:phosphatase PAP2 family protein n=1 Tax=Streptomyces sp. NPDC001744 TaxID=3364606 RepID=UPI0036CB2D4F
MAAGIRGIRGPRPAGPEATYAPGPAGQDVGEGDGRGERGDGREPGGSPGGREAPEGAGKAPEPRSPRAGRGPRPSLPRELLLVTALFLVYKFGRLFANGHETRAFRNADRVWDAERALRLPSEETVQHLLLHGEPLVRAANTYYAAVHFPATIAFLVWLYLRRPAHYLWSRRVLALLTGAALALHLLMPLAPPRMLAATGLIDTARVYGPSVYGAVPETDSMANQFAAMPSLHFGWALMVAIGLIAATRSRLRVLWLLHPLFTLLVIVGTANHYWFDALAATALLGLALLAVRAPGRRTAPPPVHRPFGTAPLPVGALR